jgi:hypothetical protein
MKKYVLIGLFAGAAISLMLFYIKRKNQEGLEFHDFVDFSGIADDLFGSAFSELPDKP